MLNGHDSATYAALAKAGVVWILAWTFAARSDARADGANGPERDAAFAVVSGSVQAEIPGVRAAYPLKQGPNRRYLVDQKNVPFLIAGDSPQALMVNLSEAEADFYFADRQSHGFNTVWINLLCRKGTGGRNDGTTTDGIHPFTQPDDLSTPNEAYFSRCDRMIRLAAKHDLLVLLDPCETIDHLTVMLRNGVAKSRAFGEYLGARYEAFDNILWMSGNDFQTWRDPKHDAVARALALGIKQRDGRHLHTVELDYHVSSSLDDPDWAPIIGLSAAYTYFSTYVQILKDYNRPNFQPVFMVEATYEFEHDSTPAVLRRQEYWTNLSGATGQLYGSGVIWPFSSDWKSKLDSQGAIQMRYVKALFEPRAWYNLVPDQNHTVVTAGYGTLDASTTKADLYVAKSDYVTAGRTPDGRLVMAYMPTLRPLTVDMAKLRGPATARWYDPSRGVYVPIAGSPLPNQGERAFTPPGKNGDGDGDWILVLETDPP
jgi:Protein of unknown function (DUF4038)/Putative collagen-binding domain of a collagenase